MSKKDFKLSAEGSLGVLALGDIGIKLWREKRKQEGKDPYERISEEDKKEEDGEETSQ